MINNIRFNEILTLSNELNSIQDLDLLLERILFEARKVAGADAGSLYIRDGDELVFSHVQNDTLQSRLAPGKKMIYSTFRVKIDRNSISGYVADTGEILNIPDVYAIPESAPYGFDSSYDELSGYKTRSMITVPMKTPSGNVIGVLQIINSRVCEEFCMFPEEDEPLIMHFANNASIVIQRARMTRTLLLRMISMAELRDPKETGAHVNRVAAYSIELYEKWAFHKGIPSDEINKNRDILRMAAMLHDVGKVAISDLILKKPARFTDEEYEIMKTHTYAGARLFGDKQSAFDEIASDVALTHHENWDGTGYPGLIDITTGEPLERGSDGRPRGLKGEEIPIFGRVVAIADVYDALSSKRVYKQAWSEEDVLSEIKKDSGKKFDPELVEIFLESADLMRSIKSRYPDKD